MTGQYPRLRSHTRKRKNGRVVTYYAYDRRPEGEPDVPLGTDYEAALRRWDEIHNRSQRIAGTLEEAFARWESEVLPGYTNVETRKGYAKHLRRLRGPFGTMAWALVTLPTLKQYLAARSAKTQANREIAVLSIIWNWARGDAELALHGIPPFPAAGMERARWKNTERPRRFKVTDKAFEAVYAEADQILRDCMDLATATGMRLTDCRTVLLPRGDVLTVEASKTGKESDFDLSLSEVLPELLARRRAVKCDHLMLLTTWGRKPKPITQAMLRGRWDEARRVAAGKLYGLAGLVDDGSREQADLWDLAGRIRAMFLRDMRKRAANLAGSDQEAAELLQHSDVRLTRRHYRTATLKPVR